MTEGIKVTPLDLLGMHGIGNSLVEIQEVFISEENLLGEIGKGFTTAMKAMDSGRIFISARGLGIVSHAINNAKSALKKALAENPNLSHQREFIHNIQMMEAESLSIRSLLQFIARMKDEGQNVTHGASVLKWITAEAAADIGQRSFELIHKLPYDRDMRQHAERLLRDSRQIRIGEGTPQIMHRMVALYLRKFAVQNIEHRKLSNLGYVDLTLTDKLSEMIKKDLDGTATSRLKVLFKAARLAYQHAILEGKFDVGEKKKGPEPFGAELPLALLEAVRIQVKNLERALRALAGQDMPPSYTAAAQEFIEQKTQEAKQYVDEIFEGFGYQEQLASFNASGN